jgi:D,D-heptose 1,7-bisphosphate phosphatase
MKYKKIVFFFDRDGVLNKDTIRPYKKKHFLLLPGTKNALEYLLKEKIKAFVISNQSVIGRKICSKKQVDNFNRMINKSINSNYNVIKKFYICPHHPTKGVGKYKKKCGCRKPKNGLLKKAIKENNLSKKNIVMIGDKKKDFLAAKKTGVTFQYRKENFFKQVKLITKNYL